MSRYEGLAIAMQAIRKSDNKVVMWFIHPEHGLLPVVMNDGDYVPLDKSIQWNTHEFYHALGHNTPTGTTDDSN